MIRIFIVVISCCFLLPNTYGQYYIFGGYNYGAITMEGSNAIIDIFNAREDHSIGPLANNFHGYRFGAGKYSKYTVLELGFGNLVANQKSTNPNQLKESAEVVVNYMSATALAPEFYIDYAIKIKFLLKKSQRDQYYYLLRLRPYYQLHAYLESGNFETELNETPNVAFNAIEDDLSHFGFNISIVIPFISDDDRVYLFAPKKEKQRKVKNRKEKPKGRL